MSIPNCVPQSPTWLSLKRERDIGERESGEGWRKREGCVCVCVCVCRQSIMRIQGERYGKGEEN